MLYYIAKEEVKQSVDYFKELQVSHDDYLFLFLLAKSRGVTENYPVNFTSSKSSPAQKNEILKSLWMLGGLFDSDEAVGRQGIMFPNMFVQQGLYNKATEFLGMVSRVKDTIEKKDIHRNLFINKDSNLTLSKEYQTILENNYLNGKKISYKHLLAWVFRYTAFEFESKPSDFEFTKVVERYGRKFLKVTKKDFLFLFENDIFENRILFSEEGVSGKEIRESYIGIDSRNYPEIKQKETDSFDNSDVLDLEMTKKFLSSNGDNPSDEDILNTLIAKKQIVLTGVPGVGKTRYTEKLKNDNFFNDGIVEMVQFHPNYSYEDFIFSETLVEENQTTISKTKKGVFLSFVEQVEKENQIDDKKNHLFIIDEINRGNIAEIFGEVILTLDRGYSAKLSKSIEGIEEISIPDNVYIVATMNTSDRNIAFLDLAIRRRFGFISLHPDYEFLSEKVKVNDLSIDLGVVLRKINNRIRFVLKSEELLIGQAYFIPLNDDKTWTKDTLKNQFNFVLLPTLKEYSFSSANLINSIVGEVLADSIQDTDDFIQAFLLEFQ